MQIEWAAISIVSTPIFTDGLMNMMPLLTLTASRAASNEVDWREAQIWLRGVAGMGLHRCICYGRDDPGFSDEVEI